MGYIFGCSALVIFLKEVEQTYFLYVQAARQLEFLRGRTSSTSTDELGDALGIAQHHDAVSGTARQHTTDDYAKRLAIGVAEVHFYDIFT